MNNNTIRLSHEASHALVVSYEEALSDFLPDASVTNNLCWAVQTISDNEFPVSIVMDNDGFGVIYPADQDAATVLDHFARALELAIEELEEMYPREFGL